ncbi:hypothetical protein JQC91_07030 [Jannaschia sp. Os4]|uniref:hypothetical protein n=1 Tax=Jannaschia sp. Os4 TaxID=2807617 RepID=UPI00193A8CFF|nr:hypothetical protein [Jannaschia sp. Os4]MBM2576053.1 hypothetical protein [Jannaschia sp. Os4]
MAKRRTRAKYLDTLTFIDEPQLIALEIGRTKGLGLAIDPGTIEGSDFLVVSLTEENWNRYFRDHVDLEYLFSYPTNRRLFHFASSDWEGDTVMMNKLEGNPPADALPGKGIFARSHTSDAFRDSSSQSTQTMYIDGDWELDEFGAFYKKYAEVYAFLATVRNHADGGISQAYKGRAISAFQEYPLRGGSSYLHLFSSLPNCIPNEQRLGLEGIDYHSPGAVEMRGQDDKLDQTSVLVKRHLNNRPSTKLAHDILKAYLQKTKLLTQSARDFSSENAHSNTILKYTAELNEEMGIIAHRTVLSMCGDNVLAFAKISLGLYRRLDVAAAFFAEGRMDYRSD